jgi:TetR/AcrR family transcriptional regulator, transcriptional repressor for nem operon
MARQREFDAEEVLENVADVFAAHGYRGASVQMLMAASGLAKQSLYNSFGDKQALYLSAVDCAAARFGAVSTAMESARNGRHAVEIFFAELLRLCASADAAENACIVSSGLVEGIAEPAIDAKLREKWSATQRLLRKAIQRGQADGSIAAKSSATELADLLMTLMSGARVSARAMRDPARLRKTVAQVLRLLDP